MMQHLYKEEMKEGKRKNMQENGRFVILLKRRVGYRGRDHTDQVKQINILLVRSNPNHQIDCSSAAKVLTQKIPLYIKIIQHMIKSFPWEGKRPRVKANSKISQSRRWCTQNSVMLHKAFHTWLLFFTLLTCSLLGFMQRIIRCARALFSAPGWGV